MIILKTIIFFNIALIAFLFVYEIYKDKEDLIAKFANKLKSNNKFLIKWLIMLCDFFMSAATGVASMSLMALGIQLTSTFGIIPKLGEFDILNASPWFFMFIVIYAIIVNTLFWLFKKSLKK
jgi:hypothetical protein